eukprot:2802382-Rhodomonas_salina.1
MCIRDISTAACQHSPNQRQQTAFLLQVVLELRSLVFYFGVHQTARGAPEITASCALESRFDFGVLQLMQRTSRAGV